MINYKWISGNKFECDGKYITSGPLWKKIWWNYKMGEQHYFYFYKAESYKDRRYWEKFCTLSLLLFSLPNVTDLDFIWSKSDTGELYFEKDYNKCSLLWDGKNKELHLNFDNIQVTSKTVELIWRVLS